MKLWILAVRFIEGYVRLLAWAGGCLRLVLLGGGVVKSVVKIERA